MSYTGRQIFMDTLMAEGVRYVFGNPGTTELPFIDSLHDYPEIDYVLCLQEAVAVSMADAYALATDGVGVVNLHVAPGLGNGLGSVYNAWEGNSPLLVTAGQQDSRMRLREPMLGHDLVAMAAPLTKWSVEANHADELPLILHRAFKLARQAPSGPVFVSLPMDVMGQRTGNPPMPPSRLFTRNAADEQGLAEAAALLRNAKQPMIVCGDGVARGDAVAELVALSEAIGAPVHSDVLPARMNFPNRHPHFRGRMARDQAEIRSWTNDADLILLIGGQFFEEVWFVDAVPFPESARIIQIEATSASIGRNYRVDCGLAGDLKLTLAALVQRLPGGHGTADAPARRAGLARETARRQEAQRTRAARRAEHGAMSVATLMAELAGAPSGRSRGGGRSDHRHSRPARQPRLQGSPRLHGPARRRHRPGPAERRGAQARTPGAPRDRDLRRRVGALHHPGPVDRRPPPPADRLPDPEQRRLPGAQAQHGPLPRDGPAPPATGAIRTSTSTLPGSTSSPSPPVSGWKGGAWRRSRKWPRRWRRRSSSGKPHLLDVMVDGG